MSPDVLRRKLQKKKKHKPYRKCPKCGWRMECELRMISDEFAIKGRWGLFKLCKTYPPGVRGGGCGYSEELFWSGGGTGRHIPSRSQG